MERKNESETSYLGGMLRMKRRGYLILISRNAPNEDHEDGEQENDKEVDRDETNLYNEITFGRRRPHSIVVDWTNKILFVLEFKRTSDQRRDYRERGESRARAQHDILGRSLEKVAFLRRSRR